MHFTAYHFIGGHTPNERIPGKFLTTAGAVTGCCSVIFNNPFLEALYQCAFTALSILKKRRLAL